ncbi:D-alanyl-D-alanine carboxypeptidase/D-alanyl-D-alanine endopeptidase [Streptomyces olivaceoviridis]
MSSASTAGGRHRKPKSVSPAVRRTLIVAAAAPVAGALFTAPSAFAADQLTPTEQRISDNLDTRVVDERIGSTFSGVVLDAESDTVIWSHDAQTALMPASNTKLATATAALTVLGPDHRFTTKVVYDNGTLTIIGGGDRTLTTDDIAALAKDAAAGLRSAGLNTVKVRIDDSLFPEPELAPGWTQNYYDDQVAPVRALSLNGSLNADTGIEAGEAFARQLSEQGITVEGGVTRGQAGPGTVPVAEHASEALSSVVKQMLKKSDNSIAEALLRATALGSGRPATFDGGVEAVRTVLSERYGVSMDNFVIRDGSGLSRDNRIPAQTIADILDNVTEPANRDVLRSIDEGLPVAGEAGSTLGPEWGRFDTADSTCAVGEVKAKTGTLTGAAALSGLTKGEDGRWRVFAFVDNDSPAAAADVKDALDGLAATVNGCWA